MIVGGHFVIRPNPTIDLQQHRPPVFLELLVDVGRLSNGYRADTGRFSIRSACCTYEAPLCVAGDRYPSSRLCARHSAVDSGGTRNRS